MAQRAQRARRGTRAPPRGARWRRGRSSRCPRRGRWRRPARDARSRSRGRRSRARRSRAGPRTKERTPLLRSPLSRTAACSRSSRAARSAALGSPRRRPSYKPIAALLAANGARRSGRDERLAFLGAAQVGLRARVIAAREQRAAERERELGRGLDEPARHRLEDGPQRAHLAVDHHVEPARRGEVGREIPGAARGRVAQGGGVVAVRGEPGRRPPVQLRRPRREAARAARRAGARRTAGGSDATCRARRAAVVEHAAVLQSRQHRVAVRRSGERVGELGAQRVDDRRAQQEVAQLRWLAGEHLADQVVADRGVGAGEVLDEGARVGMALQRQRPRGAARPPSPRCAARASRGPRAPARYRAPRTARAASSSEKARSAARISVMLPSRRRRPSPIGGSARVTITSRRAGGGKRASRSRSSWTASITSWKSSSTSTTGLLGACERVGERRQQRGPCSWAREGSPPAPRCASSPGRLGQRRQDAAPEAATVARRRCRATARRPVPAHGPRRSTSSAARSCRRRRVRPPA